MSFSYALVVTSCGRFDLLARTLESLKAHADIAPAQVIVTEDSGDERARSIVEALYPGAEVIVNRPQLGQMASIDLAYSKVAHPYIFHCEDDWQFLRSGFIAQSLRLLETLPDVSMIGLRDRSLLNPLVRKSPTVEIAGVSCWLYDPSLHPEYFSYSFNPGLRRTKDARALGPFLPLGGEADVSYHFKRKGFRMAALAEPAVTHIGDDRHVDDPTQHKRARSLVSRLGNSLRKRIKRIKRRLSPDS